MKFVITIVVLCFAACVPALSQQASGVPGITHEKIWDRGLHNAFTDLIRHQGYFYCVFREGIGHVPKSKEENGKIRILKSKNGTKWETAGLLSSTLYDLRDPHISVTPDGRLMIVMGGSDYVGSELRSRLCQVSFSKNGREFSDPEPVFIDPKIKTNTDWLWEVSWKGKTGYGIVYQPSGNDWGAVLVATTDGINYKPVFNLNLDGKPNESSIRFNGDTMFVIIRREAGVNGLMGISGPPYTDWEWKDLGMRLGGPDFIIDKKGHIICGTRTYPAPGDNRGYKTAIIKFDHTGKELKRIELPSGGDTSYPGMLVFRNKLWVSYYSSHEGKASIYLSRINLSQL